MTIPVVDPKPKKKTALAAEELARRSRKELARRSLHQFVQQAWHVLEPDEEYCDNWHIVMLCLHLEALTIGEIENLLINIPPGTMKSMLVCVFWPAWVWIDHPGKRFLYSSYAEGLSMRDSDKCRRLLASDWYQSRWPLAFSESTDNKGKFENRHGGWRMVGSITGKGTGEHPDYNCCDDPHNVLKAESDAERLTVTNWIENVYATRGVVRDVKRVLIMQRLHAQDASGVVLSKTALNWVHICLPMRFDWDRVEDAAGQEIERRPRMLPTPLGGTDPRSEWGELLWPAKYSDEKVATLEAFMGQYGAAGQLQQRPAPRGGGKFKRVWFEILPERPEKILKIVRYWDKAGTKGGTGARTASVLMASYEDPTAVVKAYKIKYIILHTVALRVGAAEREAIIKQTAETDRAAFGHVETWVEQEPGSGGLESADGTIANLSGFTVKSERVTGAKEVRCDPLASQASVQKVKLLAAPAWNQDFLDELEMFPNGKLKDLVDAAGGAFNKLNVPTGSFGSGDVVPVEGGGAPAGQGAGGHGFIPRQFTPRRY